ncbi:MAG: hypothetical protein ACKVVT_03940 [Dehalococcoidia bacterium]
MSYAAQRAALLAIAAETKAAMIPGSDASIWLMANERAAIEAAGGRCYVPGGSVISGLLRKDVLADWANAAGLVTPETWAPRSEDEVRGLASLPARPLIVKLRSHLGNMHWRKAVVPESFSGLLPVVRQLQAEALIDPTAPREPEDDWPVIQERHPGSRREVYNLVGFIHQESGRSSFMATRKVLQYPRSFGVGCGVEAAPVLPDLRDGVLRLARSAGFFGMVEAEFVPSGSGYLLIDFNPRLFHSVAFTERRGLPLSLLSYRAALGEHDAVEALLDSADRNGGAGPRKWVYDIPFHLEVVGQVTGRSMSPREALGWLAWRWRAPRDVNPAMFAGDDLMPALVDPLDWAVRTVRDPRSLATFVVR